MGPPHGEAPRHRCNLTEWLSWPALAEMFQTCSHLFLLVGRCCGCWACPPRFYTHPSPHFHPTHPLPARICKKGPALLFAVRERRVCLSCAREERAWHGQRRKSSTQGSKPPSISSWFPSIFSFSSFPLYRAPPHKIGKHYDATRSSCGATNRNLSPTFFFFFFSFSFSILVTMWYFPHFFSPSGSPQIHFSLC